MDPSKWTLDFWTAHERECQKFLLEPGSWDKVPLFSDNETALGTFVRFKAMIQDMLNPEYFAKDFTVFNFVTNETRHCQGKYHSTVINEAEETVEIGEEMMERQIIACIPIPGLNEWAKDMANSSNEIETQLEGNINKRIRLDPTCQKYSKEVFVFVYPEGLESWELKVNSIIEVIGFLDKRSINGTDEDQEGQSKEMHCIHTVQLKVRPDLYPNSEAKYDFTEGEATNLHSELKLILTQALLGDSLAADYLLFYLISSVYNRQNNEVLGKLSLNIRGIPLDFGKSYVKQLYSLISHLVVKSEFLPLTIDIMNKMDMIPRKCYTTNRLLNGFLQLSDRTHLVLDETDLQPGQLGSKGITNFQGLSNIILNQHLNYDFTYYTINYETQIPVLSLSIGKSLLPCDIDIVLTPDKSCLDNIEDTIASAFSYLNTQSLLSDKLRKYIAMISKVPFNFKEDVLKTIEDDYVKMRRIDSCISPDVLHRLIMVSKLIALCNGKNELNQEVWENCKTLENQRKLRNK